MKNKYQGGSGIYSGGAYIAELLKQAGYRTEMAGQLSWLACQRDSSVLHPEAPTRISAGLMNTGA